LGGRDRRIVVQGQLRKKLVTPYLKEQAVCGGEILVIPVMWEKEVEDCGHARPYLKNN
jgi:predicted restriction endonuclease